MKYVRWTIYYKLVFFLNYLLFSYTTFFIFYLKALDESGPSDTNNTGSACCDAKALSASFPQTKNDVVLFQNKNCVVSYAISLFNPNPFPNPTLHSLFNFHLRSFKGIRVSTVRNFLSFHCFGFSYTLQLQFKYLSIYHLLNMICIFLTCIALWS